MKKKFLSLIKFGFAWIFCFAFLKPEAQVTQTVKGVILDQETLEPLAGAKISLWRDSSILRGAISDESGNFSIASIPVGRCEARVIYEGYQSRAIPNILVNSGKETVIEVLMQELVVEMNKVEIIANEKGGTRNEMITVSGRNFTVDEAERYAGSRGDPARMASNFAGVQGTDDTRNDLVIRGNSPLGVLYRMEGLSIPNPNHFAVTGSAGGPVGMLNNKVLANSDFLTGAFPSEFGNALSGAFDLRLKNGNNERHELTAQAGIFGAELTGEGPFSNNSKASYLFNARYATLAVFQAMGVDIGTEAAPQYQDAVFKFNLPGKKGGNFSLFGVGGYSHIDFVVSDDVKKPDREIYASNSRDEYFRSGMGVAGMNYTKNVSDKSLLRISVGYSREFTGMDHFNVWRHTQGADSTYVLDSITRNMGFTNNTHKIISHVFLRHKFNARHVIQAGLFTDLYSVHLHDSIVNVNGGKTFFHRMNYDGNHVLVQPYIQWKYNPNDKTTFTAGLHGQWFSLNNSISVEPRAGMKWKFAKSQSLNLGAGLHSQLQPLYIYFQDWKTASGTIHLHNSDLDFSRALHFVIGHDVTPLKNVRLRTEIYYQYMFNIPVDSVPSSFSMLNQGSGFDRFFPGPMVNKGTGRNYGVEFTVEKFFSHNWFMLLSASLFDSKYIASNGKQYDSDFNSNYVLNVLGTKEFTWGKNAKKTLGLGGKFTYTGGKRYSPLDTLASISAEDEIPVDSMRNSLRFPNYFRLDAKITFRINAAHVTHEIGIDLVNVTGKQNLLRLQYVGGTDVFIPAYQLGFLPIFYYRAEFGFGNKNRKNG